MKKILLTIVLPVLCAVSAKAQTIYYVNKATGSDANTGASWSASFKNLTKALAAANSSAAAEVDIWVAGGIYTPQEGVTTLPADVSDTSFTFYRGNGVGKALKVYGGFVGTETGIAERDGAHLSILQGDSNILSPDPELSYRMSYHVGIIAGLAATADSVVIDGFTIKKGDAEFPGAKKYNGVDIMRCKGSGLVLSSNSSGKLAIRNCIITENQQGYLTDYTITDAQYSDQLFGAGIYDSASDLSLVNCSITGNYINPSDFYHFTRSYGGGIYSDTSNLEMVNCHVDNNYVFSPSSSVLPFQPGLAEGGGMHFSRGTLTAINCSFSYNSLGAAGGFYLDTLSKGGGLFCEYATVNLNNCSASGNSCNQYSESTTFSGLGIYDDRCMLQLDSCQIIGNNPNGGVQAIYGVGLCNSNSSMTAHHCDISNNVSEDNADNVIAFGGGVCNISSFSTFDLCTFSNNWISPYFNFFSHGGAVSNQGYSICSVGNCTFNGNGALFGGAVYNDTTTVATIHDCSFNNNTTGIETGFGAAICNERCFSYVGNCSFTHNSSIFKGGCIYNDHAISLVNDCVFESNSGPQGCAISSDSSSTYVDSCQFNDNFGTFSTIFQDGGPLYIQHCTFTSDTTDVTNLLSSLFVIGNTARLFAYGNVFSGNYHDYGGVYVDSTVVSDTIVSNIFENNVALVGGALSVSGGQHYICNNTFHNNTADSAAGGRGGAISFSGNGGNYMLANNIFYQNSAVGVTDDTANTATGTFLFSNNIFGVTDPLFVDASNPAGADGIWLTADDGLRLQACSPAIDAGMNDYVLASTPTDILGVNRITGAAVDMGAYESYTSGIISGYTEICVGSTVTLTDTVGGGTWSSSDASVANINAAGIVTALTAGTSTLSYTVTGPCGTFSSALTITVTTVPSGATITGADTVCAGSVITLNASAGGGTWTLATPAAAVVGADTGNIVSLSGVAAGIDTVYYTLTNGCGSTTTHLPFTVYDASHCILSVPGNINTSMAVDIYPNPTSGQINMQLTSANSAMANVTVTDVMGKTITTLQVPTNSKYAAEINTDPGVYILTIQIGAEKRTVRLVVE